MKYKYQQKSIRLPVEVWTRLEAAANIDGVSVSGFIRRMLYHNLGIGDEYLSNPDWLDREFSWLSDDKIKALKKAFMLEDHNKKPGK
tara:strand:+ start:1702 stop:1962 length:261 start_codon:yes stop_codon:yes gene_type:complete